MGLAKACLSNVTQQCESEHRSIGMCHVKKLSSDFCDGRQACSFPVSLASLLTRLTIICTFCVTGAAGAQVILRILCDRHPADLPHANLLLHGVPGAGFATRRREPQRVLLLLCAP